MIRILEDLQIKNEASSGDEKLYKFILFTCSENITIAKIDNYNIEKLNDIDLYIIYEIHIHNNLSPDEFIAFCTHEGINIALDKLHLPVHIILKGTGGTKSKSEFYLSHGNEADNPTILPDEFDDWIRKNNIKY